MQAIRDTERVRSKRRQSRLLTAVGLLLLVGALVASNLVTGASPELTTFSILAAYAALILGFICFNAGLQGVAKWSRRPRRDEIIDNHLKRLNDRFNIFHYVLLGGRLFDHVVVHPGGVTVLVARDNFGQVSYENGRWRKKARVIARLFNFAGPPVGNPHAEATTAAQALQESLHAEGLPIEVDAVIVFVNPRVVLTVDESSIPIRRVEDLAALLRDLAASNRLQGGQRLQTVRLLTAGIKKPDVSTPRESKGKGRRGGAAETRQRRPG